MRDIEISCLISAVPERVWKLWSDVEHAYLWDTEVKEVNLFGEFIKGTKGVCKLKNGLKLFIQLTEVNPNKSYTNKGKILGIKMNFFHTLEQMDNNQVMVIHSIQFLGIFGFLFKPILKRVFRPSLETALFNFKKLAQV